MTVTNLQKSTTDTYPFSHMALLPSQNTPNPRQETRDPAPACREPRIQIPPPKTPSPPQSTKTRETRAGLRNTTPYGWNPTPADAAGRIFNFAIVSEQWDEVMNTNLRGMHLVCRAVIPHMMQKRRGVIINMGSSSGRRPDSEYGAYATPKWGVVGYTVSLAHSLPPYGIRVNGINPHWVDTDMARAYNPTGDPDWIAPEEVAQAALYLAGHAPAAMTGQFIDLFGTDSSSC